MTAIYPSVALKSKLRELKAIADHEVVHITENGYGKYVFMSQDVFKEEIDRAVEDALYEQRVIEALERADADIANGRVYSFSSFEEMWAEVDRRRLEKES